MAVKYCVFQQKYDMSGKGSNKFYARAQSVGELSFSKLCVRISDRCTATKADVMASLEGCIAVIKQAMEDGFIVRLGDFGSFQLSLTSEGAATAKEFESSNIKGAKILFRPGADIKTMYSTLEYEKVDANSTTATTTGTTGVATGTTGA
jgi:predicted histone-like DNA-binding protein